MRIRNKKLLAVVLTVCLVLTQMVFATSVFAAETKDRFAGADRYSTAIAIAQAGWTTSQYAVLARGDEEGGGADALGAAPLAAKYKAPILLTEPAALSEGVLQELNGLGVKTVFIVGGTGAVSQAIEDLLVKNGMTVKRYFGADRIATAMDIANKEFAGATQVALANAYGFADALSISSYAAANGMPIVLTEKDALSDTAKTYIAGKKVTVVGGNGVVSDALFATLKDAVRLGGPDRYATNVAVLTNLKFDYSYVFLATGEDFPDALAGSAYAGLKGAPVVLVEPLVGGYAKVAADNVKGTTLVYAFGGASVVSQVTVDDLKAEVVKKAAAEKAALVKAAVDAINALPASDKLALTDEAAVVAARALVTDAIKADVTNLKVLEAAEARIVELKKAAEIKAAADKAVEAIAALPAKVELANEDAVVAARALVDAAKAIGAVDADITNLDVLAAAEARIAGLKALEAAVDKTEIVNVLPGINVAKLYLKAGVDTTGLSAKAGDVAMTLTTDANGNKLFYAQVAASEVTVTLAKAESQGTVAVPDGKLEGLVDSTSINSILPGINLAKVVLKAGVDTANLSATLDGVAMTFGSDVDGNKFFYAQTAKTTAEAELFVTNGLTVDVTVK